MRNNLTTLMVRGAGSLALATLLAGTARGQGLHAAIHVYAKPCGDSVILRWAPDNKWGWSSLNHLGYILERTDITDPQHFKKVLLTSQPVKPMTLEQMKTAFAGNGDKYAAIVAQCLYGKNFSLNTRGGSAGIGDKSDVWNTRYVFALQAADFDAPAAVAEGLRFTDRNVDKNAIYVYRVCPAGPPEEGTIDTGAVIIVNRRPAGNLRPKLSETIPGEHVAELHWKRAQPQAYSAYDIERSSDGRTFVQRNKTPYFTSVPDTTLLKKDDTTHRRMLDMMLVQQVFIDSLPEDHHRYFYRIRGIDAFGDWSTYSDTLAVAGIDLTPPTPAIPDVAKYMGGRSIRLHWTKRRKEPDFKGYAIMRAHATKEDFTLISGKLLDTSATSFTDTAAFIHGHNLYRILALDSVGNVSYSSPVVGMVPDTTPPAIPTGLRGHIEKNGIVHLYWKGNTDEDIKGYKVYFANSAEHAYAQLTLNTCTDTTFTDSITLKTLTRNIWYKIVAVDESNNHSTFSKPVELRKPNITPPVAPLTSTVLVDTSGVQLTWIRSASEDVISYALYRKEGALDWQPLITLKSDTTHATFYYRDSAVKPFVIYQYTAVALDGDSLVSAQSQPVTASVKTMPMLAALKTLRAVYDAGSKTVGLQWTYQGSGHYYFILYKGLENAALSKFHTVSSDQDHYTDDAISGAQRLRYAIQVVFTDDRGKTRISEPVVVGVN